jgi:hypothetical protein
MYICEEVAKGHVPLNEMQRTSHQKIAWEQEMAKKMQHHNLSGKVLPFVRPAT